MRRALVIAERNLGPDNPAVARQCVNLVWLLNERGDRQGARAYYRRALPIAEKDLGTNHPLVEAIRKSLAALEGR